MQLLSILMGGSYRSQAPSGFGWPTFGQFAPNPRMGDPSGHRVDIATQPGPGIQHNPTPGMVSQQPPGIQYQPPTIQTMPGQRQTRQTPTSAGSRTSTQGGSRNTMQAAPAPAPSGQYLDFLNKGYQPLGFG